MSRRWGCGWWAAPAAPARRRCESVKAKRAGGGGLAWSGPGESEGVGGQGGAAACCQAGMLAVLAHWQCCQLGAGEGAGATAAAVLGTAWHCR